MPQLGETLDALAEAKGEAPFSWTVWSWYFFYHYHNSNIIIMKSFKCDHLIKRHTCRMKLKIYLLWLDLTPGCTIVELVFTYAR